MYYLGILPVIKQDHQWIENYEEIFEIFKAINETQPDDVVASEEYPYNKSFTHF